MRPAPLPLAAALSLAIAGAPAVGAELRVSAAASLSESMRELAGLWRAGGGEPVVLNLGASSALALQIEKGAPADVFVSADEAQMDRLEAAGRVVESTRRALLANRLVVVVPADAAAPPAQASDLAADGVRRLALADPALVPAGVYARRWLEGLGLWPRLRPRVVPLENVRAALAAVDSGDADAAVVYATDARVARRARIAFEVPEAEAPPIRYPAAALRDAAAPEAAAAFVRFLASPAASAVFERHGFRPLDDPE
jgi:molybdate transport system substrate-binding protein